jgi:hypothetical protein
MNIICGFFPVLTSQNLKKRQKITVFDQKILSREKNGRYFDRPGVFSVT